MRKKAFNTVLEISTISLYNELFGAKHITSYKFSVKQLQSYEHTVQTAGRINSIKIEVRSSEKPHNLPHFHVTAPGKIDAVYTIDPIALQEGDVKSADNKAIMEWAEANRDKLVNMWNDYHGYRIKVS